MFPEARAQGIVSRLKLYLESSHAGAGGVFRDYFLALWSWVPGIAGLLIRSLWDRLFIAGSGAFAREAGVRILGSRYVRIEEGAYLDSRVYLHGRPAGLSIGSRTRIMYGAVLHVYNFRDLDNSCISIGSDCVIGMGAIITGQGGVAIEDKVIIAPRVMVLPVNHYHGDPLLSVREQGLETRGIHIRRGAWLGAGSIILDGVTIGENAVVGAGSVVSSDVAGGSVVAGNPARVLKTSAGG